MLLGVWICERRRRHTLGPRISLWTTVLPTIAMRKCKTTILLGRLVWCLVFVPYQPKGGESRSALRDSDKAILDSAQSARETASLVGSRLIAGNGLPPDGSAQFVCHETTPAGKPNGSHRAATAGRVALGLVISLILECVTVQELRSCSGNGVRKARKIGGWLSAWHNSSRIAVRLLPKQSLIFRRNLVRASAFCTPRADLRTEPEQGRVWGKKSRSRREG